MATIFAIDRLFKTLNVKPTWSNKNKTNFSITLNGVVFETSIALIQASYPDFRTGLAMLAILNGWDSSRFPLDPAVVKVVERTENVLLLSGFRQASLRLVDDDVFIGLSAEYWRLFNSGQYDAANKRLELDLECVGTRFTKTADKRLEVLDKQFLIENTVARNKRAKKLRLLLAEAEESVGTDKAIPAFQIKEWKKELAELIK